MTRSVLHNPDSAPGLITTHDLIGVTGVAIREDRGAVTVRVATAQGDRMLLGMTPQVLDGLIEALRQVRVHLDMHGIERTIEPQPVHSVAAGTVDVADTKLVALFIDRSLASAAAFLMPPKNARAVAKQLVAAAQEASSARGDADLQ